MAQINAYLGLNGRCREAMTFYKECLGGELKLMTGGETPGGCPEGTEDQIMHASLERGNLLLMASDMQGPEYIVGTNVSLSLSCDSEEELRTFFARLSEGGQVVLPVSEQFWGDTFGVLVDKYGFCWMLNFSKARQ